MTGRRCAWCDETIEPDDRDHGADYCSYECEADAEAAAILDAVQVEAARRARQAGDP
jgi:hypothetical protein